MTGAMVFLLALVDSIRGPLAPSGRAAVTMPAAEPVSGRVFDEADAMRADGERATGLCTVGSGRVEEIRTLLPNEWGVPYPVGLSNSLTRDQLALLARSEPGQPVGQGSTIVVITPLEDFVGTVDLPFAVDKAINIAYDDAGDHLLLLEDGQFELGRVAIGEDGMPDANTLTRFDIGHLGIRRASGMDVDIASRNLFILDSGTLQIVSADIDDEFKLVSKIDVSLAGEVELRGIAVHPASHNLFVVNAAQEMMVELTQWGAVVNRYDLADLAVVDVGGLGFGHSADLTDDADTVHLFVADSNVSPQSVTGDTGQLFGKILEVAIYPGWGGDCTAESNYQPHRR